MGGENCTTTILQPVTDREVAVVYNNNRNNIEAAALDGLNLYELWNGRFDDMMKDLCAVANSWQRTRVIVDELIAWQRGKITGAALNRKIQKTVFGSSKALTWNRIKTIASSLFAAAGTAGVAAAWQLIVSVPWRVVAVSTLLGSVSVAIWIGSTCFVAILTPQQYASLKAVLTQAGLSVWEILHSDKAQVVQAVGVKALQHAEKAFAFSLEHVIRFLYRRSRVPGLSNAALPRLEI